MNLDEHQARPPSRVVRNASALSPLASASTTALRRKKSMPFSTWRTSFLNQRYRRQADACESLITEA